MRSKVWANAYSRMWVLQFALLRWHTSEYVKGSKACALANSCQPIVFKKKYLLVRLISTAYGPYLEEDAANRFI